MSKAKDLQDQQFGPFTVRSRHENEDGRPAHDSRGHALWDAECICGEIEILTQDQLLRMPEDDSCVGHPAVKSSRKKGARSKVTLQQLIDNPALFVTELKTDRKSEEVLQQVRFLVELAVSRTGAEGDEAVSSMVQMQQIIQALRGTTPLSALIREVYPESRSVGLPFPTDAFKADRFQTVALLYEIQTGNVELTAEEWLLALGFIPEGLHAEATKIYKAAVADSQRNEKTTGDLSGEYRG